jgi:NRPS condensation-like uncharacterized protein
MIEDAPEEARHPASTENLCRESSFPLTPLQKGMFVQNLAGLRPGLNIIQVICEMRDDLDLPVFSRAWQKLVSRHEVFRTSFHLTDESEPRQLVNAWAGSFLSMLDLTNLTTEERRVTLEEFLERDRRKGFDLSNCPSMRLSILKEEDKLFRFVWTVHHILLDARGLLLALDEVFALYEALREEREPSLSPAPSFRRHVEWHEAQDWAGAESFWRAMLEGFQTPTPLLHVRPAQTFSDELDLWASHEIQLGSSARELLGTLASAAGVTLNTVFQGAWAILLSRYSGESDVVFGARSPQSVSLSTLYPCVHGSLAKTR